MFRRHGGLSFIGKQPLQLYNAVCIKTSRGKYDNPKLIKRQFNMDIIITYDIKRNHTEIKTELKSLGYEDTIAGVIRNTNTAVIQLLPNTTLLKYGATDTHSVMGQVVSVINKHNGGLDRIFCAQLAVGFSWSGQ
jgi:hypothetical protein